MAQAEVTIWRLDDGGKADKGDYECSECSWRATGVDRTAAKHHAHRTHKRSLNTQRREHHQRKAPIKSTKKRKGEEELKQDARAVAERERKRRWRNERQEEAARAVRLNKQEARWPFTISAEGSLCKCRAFYSPGTGKRKVVGGADQCAFEGYQVAMSLIGVNSSQLRGWLGCETDIRLLTRAVDLSVTAAKLRVMRNDASSSACGALALVLLLGGELVGGRVAVTGCVDLRGQIKVVGSVKEKILHCMAQGVEHVIVPDLNLKRLKLKGWPAKEDERHYVEQSVHGVNDVIGMLKHVLTDFQPPEDALALLDGKNVGVSLCRGLGERDEVGDVQVQCCWTEPGNMSTIITGNASYTTQEAIKMMGDLVVAQTLPIVEALNLQSIHKDVPFTLFKRGANLHVHMDHCYHPVHPTYQMAAIYLAMASLMVGRRIPDSVMVFGAVDNTGELSANLWELTQDDLEPWWDGGCRRVVFGAGVKLTKKAETFAATIDEDGKPRMKLTTARQILEVVPMVLRPTDSSQDKNSGDIGRWYNRRLALPVASNVK